MPPMRTRVAFAVALAALTAAACRSASGPDAPEVTVSIGVQHPATMSALLRTRLGPRVVDLTLVNAGGASRVVRAPGTGAVPVSVVLVTPDSDTLAAVSFTHQFEPDADHWVRTYVGRNRDPYFCEGAVLRTALRGSTTDTLFVMHGSLPHGAIC